MAGTLGQSKDCLARRGGLYHIYYIYRRQALIHLDIDFLLPSPRSSCDWFTGIQWSGIPSHLQGNLVCQGLSPRPRLLGGSSKLAKLAEERRKKAAAAVSPSETPSTNFNSLDRLGKPKDAKENATPQPQVEAKKYPIRRKREPTPPPREPTPEPEEVKEELPSLKASPTSFGKALSNGASHASGTRNLGFEDLLGTQMDSDPFKEPSPDDVILRAQKQSKLAQ